MPGETRGPEGATEWGPRGDTPTTQEQESILEPSAEAEELDRDIVALRKIIETSDSMLDRYRSEISLSKKLNERRVIQGQADEGALKTRDGLKFKGDIINDIFNETTGLTEEDQIRKAIEEVDTYLSDIESRDPEGTETWVVGVEPSYATDGSDTFEISNSEQEKAYLDIKEKLNNMLIALKARS